MLKQITDSDLRVYVVWVPMYRGMERDVPDASREVADPRSRHYWDGNSASMKAVRATLGVTEDAWDVFLLYPRGVRWDHDLPPKPEFWMHQLDDRGKPRIDGPLLDAGILLARTRALLERH